MKAYRGVLKARISKLYGGDVTVDKARKLKARKDATPRDCLLYTSPSPRDLSTSRMPSSA